MAVVVLVEQGGDKQIGSWREILLESCLLLLSSYLQAWSVQNIFWLRNKIKYQSPLDTYPLEAR